MRPPAPPARRSPKRRTPGCVAVREIADENWNAAYEATLGPVTAGPFLVRPSWASVPEGSEGRIEIVIDPKMSFGTGYHESTRLVLGLLPGIVRPGDRVLDAGCGTGILAIAALRLGAASALAFDVDAWAEENAAENFARNGVEGRAEVRIGSVEAVPETGFDVVLANIHREVLLELMSELARRVRPGGRLVLAGLLRTDADAMRAAVQQAGFTGTAEAEEGAWWAWAGIREEG
jgi:ribosomal protein L11 methyltransferase